MHLHFKVSERGSSFPATPVLAIPSEPLGKQAGPLVVSPLRMAQEVPEGYIARWL